MLTLAETIAPEAISREPLFYLLTFALIALVAFFGRYMKASQTSFLGHLTDSREHVEGLVDRMMEHQSKSAASCHASNMATIQEANKGAAAISTALAEVKDTTRQVGQIADKASSVVEQALKQMNGK